MRGKTTAKPKGFAIFPGGPHRQQLDFLSPWDTLTFVCPLCLRLGLPTQPSGLATFGNMPSQVVSSS